ncbi:uncharacterized protein [Magallana gigas]|uniref:uncharacterized protein isoform X1 n=1 Tax=Magallana gigas TaxID=29159 RepID=UPI00333E3879
MNYHRMSIIFVLFGIVYLLSVKVTNGQQTNSQDSTGSNHSCPVLILYPSFLYATFGKRVNFTGMVEAKLEYPIEGLWQRLQNGVLLKNINPNEKKYQDTNALTPSQLVINNVDFDDVGEYRLQVRISTGWCSSNTVRLQHVYGILDYNASCNKTRECDERKHLQCSRKTCLCYDSYYPFNQACFPKSDLRAPIHNYNISDSSVYFEWTQPSHSRLIQNYTVIIRHNNGTSITSKSVGKQASFTFPYNFIPGYRYYVKIASNVQIHQPSEQFTVNSELGIVLAPLPPGPIDRNVSNFHPEKLRLKWAVPINNTRVDFYYITISDQHSTIITSYPSSNDLEVSGRFQPGTNYTVTLYAISYGSYSPQYTEEIHTLRTPLLTISPSGAPNIPYLSNLEVNCTVRNYSNFPPTLETKWQRNQLDFNISDAMYKGSSLDLFNPKLVINRIDFDRDNGDHYRCMARNSEGWGSSLSNIRIDVIGSIKFLESCNYSRECRYGAFLTCSNKQCLCSSSYYHKNEVCYQRYYLRAQSIAIQSTTCDISITWNHPSRNADLVTGYEVYLQERTEHGWKSSERIYAGNSTSYKSPCTLQSGRLYRIYIRSVVLLGNPTQTITVDTSFYDTILEPRKPGAIETNLSNFSADGVHLVWEESDGFVNRYIVRIDDHEQETLDKKPTIDWDQLLLPDTLYNVTITAISYGFSTNYHSFGRRLSVPAIYWIEISSVISCNGFITEDQCREACSCDMNNTDICNSVTGDCQCKTGWKGHNCSEDVDECQENLRRCDTSLYQVCVNSLGSSHCECLYGGQNLTLCKQPRPPSKTNLSEIKINTETTFDIDISREEFLENSTEWQNEFTSSLKKFYKEENVRGLIDIIILSIRQLMPLVGGQISGPVHIKALIVNYEIIGSKGKSSTLKADLATSMKVLLTGEKSITVFDKKPKVNSIAIKDQNGKTVSNITKSSTPCALLKGIGGSCPNGEICDDTYGIAKCVLVSQALSDTLIITITVGISVPVSIAVCAFLMVYLCRQRKSKQTDGHLTERIEKLESKLSSNPYSAEPRSNNDTQSVYESINSCDLYSNEYLELDDVSRHVYSNMKHNDMDYENNLSYNVPVRETQYQKQQNEMRNERPTRVCMFTLKIMYGQ